MKKSNGGLDVFKGLLVGVSLGVAPLEFGAGGKIALLILFNYYRETIGIHKFIPGAVYNPSFLIFSATWW